MNKSPTKILITGASGFIGKELVKELCKENEIYAFVHNAKKINIFPDSVKIIEGDILDRAIINKAIENKDIVYHLAVLKDELADFKKLYNVNVEGTKNILESALKNKVKQFIFVSTVGVIDGCEKEGSLTEHSQYNPQTNYEKTKCEAEKIVLEYYKQFHLPITVIRPTMVYGPESKDWLMFIKLVKKNLPIVGKGDNFFHLVYIKDVIQSLILVKGNQQAVGQIYNIADGIPYTYKEVYKTIAQYLGINYRERFIPKWLALIFGRSCELYNKLTKSRVVLIRPYMLRLIRNRRIDISKALKEINYLPCYDLEKGMKETINWFKKKSEL